MSDLSTRLRALGVAFTPDQLNGTRDLYAPLAPTPEAVGARARRNFHYGRDDRHVLDVFAHPGKVALSPVVVFVHGGGFVQGDKGKEGEPFYNNFGAWAVREGFVGVTMTYRLAPAHGWPAGPEDIESAIHFLRQGLRAEGGDPDRIVLIGQSAGATHVASWIARQGCAPGSPTPVAGAVLLSGIYDLALAGPSPMHDAYYGADRALHPQRSTLSALAATSLPCLFTIGELEPPLFQAQAAALVAARWAAQQRYPEMHYLPGHNHVSSIMQLGSPEDDLGPVMAAFVRRVCA
ncbi:MAG: alpha/beta hydrolase [Nevskiaceae bacterium]|nr:alpha/beta hydrolase [Nevskiaceae bacterium]